MLTAEDLAAVGLTLKLATVTTFVLLMLGLPLAWWLARGGGVWRSLVSALVALPLVLPPSVLGFYLLLGMGPDGPIGSFTNWLGLGTLAFSFPGLVLASVLYSLPFMVQPLQNAFASLDQRLVEAATTLGAGPLDRFVTTVLPLCRPGLVTALVLTFAHTLGEFGVVLMVGGNIPGETQVVSVKIYEQVELLQYSRAHWLSAGMLIFSFLVLLLVYATNGRRAGRWLS